MNGSSQFAFVLVSAVYRIVWGSIRTRDLLLLRVNTGKHNVSHLTFHLVTCFSVLLWGWLCLLYSCNGLCLFNLLQFFFIYQFSMVFKKMLTYSLLLSKCSPTFVRKC